MLPVLRELIVSDRRAENNPLTEKKLPSVFATELPLRDGSRNWRTHAQAVVFPIHAKSDLQRENEGSGLIIPYFSEKKSGFLPCGERTDESRVIFGRIDSDRRFVDDTDQDRFPLMENAELLKPLGNLTEGLRRFRERKKEIARF